MSESPASGMAPADITGGIDIHSKQRKYTFAVLRTANSATTLVYYMWAVTQRTLHIGKNRVSVE